MQLMFLDKTNKDSYKPEVVSLFRVSLAIAFRWAWIQANPVRCAGWAWIQGTPARGGSAIAPRSSLSIPRSCERAGS